MVCNTNNYYINQDFGDYKKYSSVTPIWTVDYASREMKELFSFTYNNMRQRVYSHVACQMFDGKWVSMSVDLIEGKTY